jgi:hypothetical protein
MKENAIKFVNEVKLGKISVFWKSEIEKLLTEVQHVAANSLQSFIGWIKLTILVVYSFRIQSIANFAEAAETLIKKKKAFFVTFSLTMNDWSGPNANFEEIPCIIFFSNVKSTKTVFIKSSQEEIMNQIDDLIYNDPDINL